MTQWTTWEPGAGRMADVDQLAAAFVAMSTRAKDASSELAAAARAADPLKSQAITAWTAQTTKTGAAVTAFGQQLSKTAQALSDYSTTVHRIASRSAAARSDLGRFPGAAGVARAHMSAPETVLSPSAIESIAEQCETAYGNMTPATDPPTPVPGTVQHGIRDALRTLNSLAQQRRDADHALAAPSQPAQHPLGFAPMGPEAGSGDEPPLTWDTTTVLTPDIAADDPLDPSEINQGQVGDCWLLAVLMAMMETDDGQDFLRSGIIWDPSIPGYKVRLYVNGEAVWVTVTQLIANSATITGGKAGIVSLYEAAILQLFGKDFLNGNQPSKGAAVIGNDPTNTTGLVFSWSPSISKAAENSQGSTDGTIAVASTPFRFFPFKMTRQVDATPDPYSGATTPIEIVANHAYEVVDIRNGMVGLRDPWGSQSYSGPAKNGAGVFYISLSDFGHIFATVTQE